MALTVSGKREDVTGSMRMTCGIVTASDVTEGTFDTGLQSVASVVVTPTPDGLITESDGVVTMTPEVTGAHYFIAFGA